VGEVSQKTLNNHGCWLCLQRDEARTLHPFALKAYKGFASRRYAHLNSGRLNKKAKRGYLEVRFSCGFLRSILLDIRCPLFSTGGQLVGVEKISAFMKK
jgi:hypothetical protein